jgi:DNA-binding transcriptional regulator YdaS (Cro superfamily)
MDLKTYITSGARGRAAKLAADIGVSPSMLSQMANGDCAINPKRCVAIGTATQGQVSRKDLRPDDWQDICPELAIHSKKTPA